MRLTDPDRVLPERLVNDEFVLRPVTVDDAEADHAAVMDAQTQLRLWSQSDWPADDFTVEENRADLLAMQHRSRSTATRRLEASTIALPPRSRAARYLRGRGARRRLAERAQIRLWGDVVHSTAPVVWAGSARRANRVSRRSLHLCQSAAKR